MKYKASIKTISYAKWAFFSRLIKFTNLLRLIKKKYIEKEEGKRKEGWKWGREERRYKKGREEGTDNYFRNEKEHLAMDAVTLKGLRRYYDYANKSGSILRNI